MKKLVLWTLCLLFAVTAVAQERSFSVRGLRHGEPTLLPDGNIPFEKMIQDEALTAFRARRSGPLRPETNVVLEGSEPAFVLPIVGSTPGQGGTFFRSETVIVNRRTVAQNIAIYYFPTNTTQNCSRTPRILQVPAESWLVWGDFVADYLGTSGLGAVIAIAVTSSGNADANGAIDGNSRIWTVVPGSTGTASQNFPSVSLFMPAGGQSSFGLRHDEFYRTNYGIFNYGSTTRNFNVFINGLRAQNSTSGSVAPCTLVLANVPAGVYGGFELFISAADGGDDYFTFGSSVDNTTGDSWSVIGRSF